LTAGELAVTDGALAADVAVDRDVVGWIGEHKFGLVVAEQVLVGRSIARIAAQHAMLAQHPQTMAPRIPRRGAKFLKFPAVFPVGGEFRC
jgi:hypothetical protein